MDYRHLPTFHLPQFTTLRNIGMTLRLPFALVLMALLLNACTNKLSTGLPNIASPIQQTASQPIMDKMSTHLSQVVGTLIHMEHLVKDEKHISQDAPISGLLVSQNNAKAANLLLTLQTPHEQKEKRALIIAGIAVVLLLLVVVAALVYVRRLRKRNQVLLKRMGLLRDNFYTNVTHELRTPLTLILGLSKDLHQDKALPEYARSKVQTIEKQGDSLLTLINQLLDFARVRSAVDSPEWTNADLSAHLGMIVESYRDFATKRYGRVSVKVAREGANAVISVIDTGVGIAPDAIPHLFEPFYKVGTDASQQGTGIGLALVKQIVDALDGIIMVESMPEKGSTFVVRLPIRNVCKPSNMVATHGNTPLLSQTEERLDDEANHNNDEQRMLIVEDNADLGAYIGSLFSAHYAVYYATNGTEALSKAMELVPDIIITDRMMPGVDGLEVCRKVRQSDVLNHIPIVVVTGKITEQERLEGIKAGADAYINKPFNSEELITMVEKLLDRHQNLRKKYAENNNETTEMNDHRTEAERQFLTKVADFTYLLLDNHALDVNALAEKLNMSVRQFHRKLVALTGNTPGVFILNLKMQKAKLLLETKYELTIEDISERCGFEHASSFYHAFKKAFGITPAEYRKKRG